MSKHTPGPWTYYLASKHYPNGSDNDYGRIVWAIGHGEVAQTPGRLLDTEDEANARLIAAAPDLLEALEQVVNLLDYDDDSLGARMVARAAILKATGEQ